MFFTIILGFAMGSTGTLLKYDLFPTISRLWARNLHSLLSLSFSIVLAVMVITGLILFLYPYHIKYKSGNNKNSKVK